MKLHNVTQGTEEWDKLRLGRVGGSKCASLLVNGNGNGIGVGAQTLIYQLASEKITGQATDSYQSFDMLRGSEYEPLARREYENRHFVKVHEVGYVSEGDHLGYSPDGMPDGGLIEIKCLSGPEFVRFFDTRRIDKKYVAQMQWGMWITGRPWCDFVVYHPDFPDSLIVERVKPDKKMHARFSEIVPVFVAELEKVTRALQYAKEVVS